MSIDFVAVDVETANRHRASVCALGTVRVRDGQIIERFATLVRPPVPGFETMNVRVHGIREADVADAPDWPAVYRRFVDFVGDDVLVAHNAAFDLSVLRRSSIEAGVPVPRFTALCSRRLAEEHLVLPRYGLEQVATHLGLDPFVHHDALQDATAAAQIVLALAGITDADTITAFVGGTGHVAPAGFVRPTRAVPRPAPPHIVR